ncbi:MAG: YetF domain-containing protein [Betaproteobacteria bacterium]
MNLLGSQPTLPFWAMLVRAALIYFVLLIAVRITGKEQISALTPYDFMISILFGSLAAHPLISSVFSVWPTAVSLATLAVLNVALSMGTLKSRRLHRLIGGSPIVLVDQGKVVKKGLREAFWGVDDLLSKLRVKGYPNLADVEFAILEANGEVSVIPKPDKAPLTPADLHVPTNYEGVPVVLIENGRVLYENLAKVGLDYTWLSTQLRNFNIHRPNQVYLASLDTEGKLFLQTQRSADEQPSRPGQPF